MHEVVLCGVDQLLVPCGPSQGQCDKLWPTEVRYLTPFMFAELMPPTRHDMIVVAGDELPWRA